MNQQDFNLFARSRGISSLTQHDYFNHIQNHISPNIVEERQMNAVVLDIYSKLIQERQIMLGTPIDATVGNIITAQLLYLDSLDSSDIIIYINTPGGEVTSGLSIKSTMDYINSDVATITIGMAASMGSIIGSSGTKGKRSILKTGKYLLHQPLINGGIGGQASDIQITAQEILKTKKELYDILCENTGQPYEKIEKDADRDFWLNAQESKDYGLVDEIITKK
jgi:ATP-dependent Clp protease protease subunit